MEEEAEIKRGGRVLVLNDPPAWRSTSVGTAAGSSSSSTLRSVMCTNASERVVSMPGALGARDPRCAATMRQGLTLVDFSAQLEPCLSQETTLNTPENPPYAGYTTRTRTPYPIQSAQVELKSGRV